MPTFAARIRPHAIQPGYPVGKTCWPPLALCLPILHLHRRRYAPCRRQNVNSRLYIRAGKLRLGFGQTTFEFFEHLGDQLILGTRRFLFRQHILKSHRNVLRQLEVEVRESAAPQRAAEPINRRDRSARRFGDFVLFQM